MYIYVLWYSEDRAATYWAYGIVGIFETIEDAQRIADRENYPMISSGYVWGGAKDWKPAGLLGEDRMSTDKGIGAWYIQKVLMGSIISEPTAHPEGKF